MIDLYAQSAYKQEKSLEMQIYKKYSERFKNIFFSRLKSKNNTK